MAVRGVRGATSIAENSRDEIILKTREMLEIMISKNNIRIEDIASALFSVTEGIDAEFPAVAARRLGWVYTPLMCTMEIPVKGSLKNCIRVLLHVNSEKKQEEIIHIYLNEAEKLRPDLNSGLENKYYTSEKT
jgi:chorismate mutase